MVEEREQRGERGDALHHLVLHVTAARLLTGVCWLKSRGEGRCMEVRPRTLRGCHALAPTPQGQP